MIETTLTDKLIKAIHEGLSNALTTLDNLATQLSNFVEYINKFQINSIPITFLDKQYKDYLEIFDFTNLTCRTELLNENAEVLYENIVNASNSYSAHAAIDTLKTIYKMDDYQFKIYIPSHVQIVSVANIPDYLSFPNSILIPLIKKNVEIIDLEMQKAGYYHVADKKYIDSKGRNWINIIYDPIKQDSITDQLRKHKRLVLYHCSPIENEKSIELYDILPSNEGRVYKYNQPRIYLHTVDPDDNSFIEMMKLVTINRKKHNKNFSGEYNIYDIPLKNISENVEFYYDPHGKDAVYITEKIPFSAITNFEKVKY